MKNFIKYVCIAMIVLASISVLSECYLLFRSTLGAPAQLTLSFINHVAMLIVGIMGLKFREEDEKQKMLAGISGMQTMFCLLAMFVGRYSIWVAIKTLSISKWLTIICSVLLLAYYIRGAIRVKKGKADPVYKYI